MHLDEQLVIAKTTWPPIASTKDSGAYIQKVVRASCRAMRIDVTRYSATGKTARGGKKKLKFPQRIIRIAESKNIDR